MSDRSKKSEQRVFMSGAAPAPEKVELRPAIPDAIEPLHDLEVLNTIHRISDSMGLSLSERLTAIVKVVAFHLKSDASSIYLEDKEGRDRLVLAATHGLNPDAVGSVSLATGEGVTGWVGRERVALPIGDTATDPRYKKIDDIGEEGFRSILAAPIRLDQRLIGVINVQSRKASEYPPHRVRLLETIGMHLGGIIRTAQLYEDTKTQLKQLRIINGIGQALVSTLHLDPLLEMVMEKSREVTHTRGGLLRLWDEEEQQLVTRVTTGESLPEEELRPLYLGEGAPGITALKQEPYLINDIEMDARPLPAGVVHNYLCVPVVYQGRAIGTISVYDRLAADNSPASITANDVGLLKSLANQVAVAIKNAQVCDELTHTVQDLRQTRDMLVQTETLAAVGRMAEGVAREVQAPLIPVQGLVKRLLSDDNPSPEEQKAVLASILMETERMNAFVAELMDLARSDQVRLERHRLDDIVRAAVETLRHRIVGSRITLDVHLDAGTTILLDPEQLIKALGLILDNAVDALPTGGVIAISSETASYAVDDDRVDGLRVSIKDSGPGIADAALAHLFTPCFSTHEGGRGLSLSIAYRVVRAHGGTLLAHNPPAGGAEFTLFLPSVPPRKFPPPAPTHE